MDDLSVVTHERAGASRRTFLGAAAASVVAPSVLAGRGASAQEPAGTLDVHVHLFGVGDDGSGCSMSEHITSGVNFVLLRRALGIDRGEGPLDARYRAALLAHVRASGIDRVAVLAQDGVYDEDGELDRECTHWFVPKRLRARVLRARPDPAAAVRVDQPRAA